MNEGGTSPASRSGLLAAGPGQLARGDFYLSCVLAFAGACAVWYLTGLLNHIPLLVNEKADDVWFEGDVKRVFDNMTDRFSAHYRTNMHPLFSLLGLVCTKALQHLFKITPLAAVRVTLTGCAALWMAAFFHVLRLLGLRRLDSSVFTILAATSSAAMFWATVPETYLFGSLTIVIVLLVAALSERRPIPPWLDVVTAAAALSMLVTNWMYALASMWTRRRLRDVIQLASNSFMVVVVLWGIEKFLARSAEFFLGYHEHVVRPVAAQVIPVFFLDSMVMPDVQVVANDSPSLWPKFSVQGAHTWHLTHWGVVALAAWISLLVMGVWSACTMASLQRFRLLLALAIAGQLLLHLLYGNETFLYVLDFMPTLVLLAALTTLGRLRWFALAAAGVAIVTCALHNYAELSSTLQILATRVE
jgi:hypothetical protein